MSLWWIGVKGEKLTVFESTEIEAFSFEFEEIYGVAFGSYRSEAQAQAGADEHRTHLIKQAAIVVQTRQEDAKSKEKLIKDAKKAKKAVEKGAEKSESADKGLILPENTTLYAINELMKQFQELKLVIARCLSAVFDVKKELLEQDDKNKD